MHKVNEMQAPDRLQAARDQGQWRGQRRPPFAAPPGPGQQSVWDYPRPPRLAPDSREVVVRWGGVEVARTRDAVRHFNAYRKLKAATDHKQDGAPA